MKLKIFETVVCRTPAFNLEANLPESLSELTEKIREASSVFYEVVVAGQPSAGTKAAYSLWKYFNRAKYRATPFGTFAAITLAPFSLDIPLLVLAREMIAHHFTDWDQRDQYTANIKKAIAHSTLFRANSTLYL